MKKILITLTLLLLPFTTSCWNKLVPTNDFKTNIEQMYHHSVIDNIDNSGLKIALAYTLYNHDLYVNAKIVDDYNKYQILVKLNETLYEVNSDTNVSEFYKVKIERYESIDLIILEDDIEFNRFDLAELANKYNTLLKPQQQTFKTYYEKINLKRYNPTNYFFKHPIFTQNLSYVIFTILGLGMLMHLKDLKSNPKIYIGEVNQL